MNGSRVRTLRVALGGLPARMFADLLGCSQHTVYRWERAPAAEIHADTHQARVLQLLDDRHAVRSPVLRKIGDGVRIHGGLYGLHMLLADAFPGEDDQARLARRAKRAARKSAQVAAAPRPALVVAR